jgi:hypothetical protein
MLFAFRMELANGEPADPAKLETAVPNWRLGDSVFVSPKAALPRHRRPRWCARCCACPQRVARSRRPTTRPPTTAAADAWCRSGSQSRQPRTAAFPLAPIGPDVTG